MQYYDFLTQYLDGSAETVEQFARRAGVHRSTVYRAMAGENVLFQHVERMINAAGGSIKIFCGKARRRKRTAPEVSSNA